MGPLQYKWPLMTFLRLAIPGGVGSGSTMVGSVMLAACDAHAVPDVLVTANHARQILTLDCPFSREPYVWKAAHDLLMA